MRITKIFYNEVIFSSNRSGKGNDDIYQYTKYIPPPVVEEVPEIEEVIDSTETTDTPTATDGNKVFEYILTLKTIEKQYSRAGDPSSNCFG